MHNDTATTHAGDDPPFDERRFLEGLAEIAALPASDPNDSVGSDQLDMIEALVQRLPIPLPDRWLAAAWATAHSIIQEDWRAAALAVLAFHAQSERQDDLYQVVFELLRSIEYAAPALGYIVSAALPDRHLDTARAIALALSDERERRHVLESIDERTTEASYESLTPDQKRVQRAQVALLAFCATDTPAYRNEDAETQLSDLLCDLHHLADQLGLDWEQIVTRAGRYYAQETHAPGVDQPHEWRFQLHVADVLDSTDALVPVSVVATSQGIAIEIRDQHQHEAASVVVELLQQDSAPLDAH